MTQIGTDTRKNGGAFDILLKNGSTGMGFKFAPGIAGGKQQVSNIAPPFRVGNDSAYSTEAFQPVVWGGTADGGDKELFESGEHRYNDSDAGVATSYDAFLTLASQWNSSDATQTLTCRNFVDYEVGDKYVLGGKATTCRAYNLNSQAWANSGTFTNSVQHLCSNDVYVWAALGASEDYWRLTNTTWAQPAATVKATGFAWWQERLYRSLGNNIFVSNDSGATKKGWSQITPKGVGWPSTNILDMWVGGTLLLVAKPEGLYGFDGNTFQLLVDMQKTVSTDNGIGGCEYRGQIYFPNIQEVVQAVPDPRNSVSGVTPITVRMQGSENKERYWHGTPKVMVASPRSLYAGFHQAQGTYPEVLQYNGRGGWHLIYRGSSSTNLNAFGYSRLLGWLLVNDGSTRYKRITNVGSSEYPDYAASGYVISPKFDGGYPLEPKHWHSLKFKCSSMTSSETIKASYSVDGAAYVDAATIVDNGEAEILLAGSTGQVEGLVIQVKLTFARGATITLSPRLEWPVVVYGLVAPRALDTTDYQVILDEEQPLHTGGLIGDYATYTAMEEFLSDARETANTLTLVNAFNKFTSARITNLSYRNIDMADVGGQVRPTAVAIITLLDMLPGLHRTVETTATVAVTVGSAA